MNTWSNPRAFSTLPIRIADRLGITYPLRHPVQFVTERENWSIRWDGTSIMRALEKEHPGTMAVTDRPYLLNRRIVHFGSQFQCVTWAPYMPISNHLVCTFFHGKREDDPEMARHVDQFMRLVPRLSTVVTAARMIEDRLISWGVPREKLVRIPIGVDTNLFRPIETRNRHEMRVKYGIRPDQFVIGSFQKDGVGWGEGLEPKMIKGPDILVAVAKELSRHVPVLVLLTGPARGFVKRGLAENDIPFIHEYLDDYPSLAERFSVLDAYINPSREEGGPKGVLEGMAAGVPVVSTRVGMVPDIVTHGKNGYVHEVGDIDGLVYSLLNIARNPADQLNLIKMARQDILSYDWTYVAEMHYRLVYEPLLKEIRG